MDEPVFVNVGDVPFVSTNRTAAASWIVNAGTDRLPISIRLPNSYSVALASKDADYRAVLTGPGVNFPDGAPVAWIMRRGKSGDSKAQQVRGPSLFVDVLDRGRGAEIGHFFLGGSPDALAKLLATAHGRYPGIKISGSYSPPFGPLDHEFYAEAVQRIRKADPDIVWIGLGTPKQDYAGATITHRTGRPTVAVGAAFDFLAGTSKEAPRWLQETGFEWLFRLATEPKRLWRRYLVGNLKFIFAVIQIRDRGRRARIDQF
ncbi:WecB/TagA/CpsF family glycosyltransferase [Rhodococcus sp. BL-253-APC-6A1W]|uniref:WecB/TagA/CpsF family glycosyltransferase n=1 Tax=Rhodococcus sp. BL-253-APC-6A1W TaxID=2725307 RepID=UPI00146AF375|nr:WecB/TagA/CpsF family glycosyltransferase [Rhodococcus sp. BL-253-APC-6A1W]NMD93848.1 WecB/TagA/CpsF family glycosyltransferase [Rhodococcus sp. BL-253-APC-6A1W]